MNGIYYGVGDNFCMMMESFMLDYDVEVIVVFLLVCDGDELWMVDEISEIVGIFEFDV